MGSQLFLIPAAENKFIGTPPNVGETEEEGGPYPGPGGDPSGISGGWLWTGSSAARRCSASSPPGCWASPAHTVGTVRYVCVVASYVCIPSAPQYPGIHIQMFS